MAVVFSKDSDLRDLSTVSCPLSRRKQLLREDLQVAFLAGAESWVPEGPARTQPELSKEHKAPFVAALLTPAV